MAWGRNFAPMSKVYNLSKADRQMIKFGVYDIDFLHFIRRKLDLIKDKTSLFGIILTGRTFTQTFL